MLACIRWTLPLLAVLAFFDQASPAEAASWSFGQCTYYVAVRRPEVNAWATGNAWSWVNAAEAAGKMTGSLPAIGAVATFQPWVEGAGAIGHVGIVDQVAPDGAHFLLSEMNFAGLGLEDHRWAAAGPGVRFVY